MIIVIKIGTQSIISLQDGLNYKRIEDIIQEIVKLKKEGHNVLLVSSGAGGLGRKLYENIEQNYQYKSEMVRKQMLASIGQPGLMVSYSNALEKYGMIASQILLTKEDTKDEVHLSNILCLFSEILNDKNILPIINENDSVAIQELMFTDNDELSSLVSELVNADVSIILTSVNGVYTGNPSLASSELIKEIDFKEGDISIDISKTLLGRGGMVSKLEAAKRNFENGIPTYIINAEIPNGITRTINGENLGTLIKSE